MKEYQPLKVNSLKGTKIKQIASGDYHSGFLSEDSVLYMTGDNTRG